QDRAASPRPRCLPKTALPPQDRAASPRPRCLPKTALPPQDRTASPRPRCIAAQQLIGEGSMEPVNGSIQYTH
ncbi:MAG: hypothetical protein F6K65_32955, partial [Moorea sp. SIO3C2]|nr:hypothetical protein [Moorena sp. SIO3C2]